MFPRVTLLPRAARQPAATRATAARNRRRRFSFTAAAFAVVLPLTAAAVPAAPRAAAGTDVLRPASSAATFAGAEAAVGVAAAQPLRGQDISWPNCKKGMGVPSRRTKGLPMPRKSAKFVVVGLSNGMGFHPNPCLATQVAWAKRHHVWTAPYAFTTYPSSAQLKKYGKRGPYQPTSKMRRLRNTGYAQAKFNVANMRRAGLSAPFIWVDVEYSRSPAKWSGSRTRNRAVLEGVVAGYRAEGLRVGFYTSERPWRDLIGKKRYKLPEWRTVGPSSKVKAVRKCRVRGAQGGRIVLAQWWHNARADFDVTCPAFSSRKQLLRYFHRY